jgi:hypothetical protein
MEIVDIKSCFDGFSGFTSGRGSHMYLILNIKHYTLSIKHLLST